MSPFQVDWHAVFVPSMALLELFVRGTAMYLGILVFMRLLNRQKGALSTADLLVLIVVADAAQNAMSAQYTSLTEGIFLVGTIFLWDYVLDRLSYHSPAFRKLLSEPPVLLIADGQLQYRNLKKEMLTRDDVLEQLREQGVDDIKHVRKCCLESDGHFSVIRMDDSAVRPASKGAGVA